jgi:hypothetical protein
MMIIVVLIVIVIVLSAGHRWDEHQGGVYEECCECSLSTEWNS